LTFENFYQTAYQVSRTLTFKNVFQAAFGGGIGGGGGDQGSIAVKVKMPDDNEITIMASPNDSGKRLRMKIKEITGQKVTAQRLIFRGKDVNFEDTVEDLKISNGVMLNCFPKVYIYTYIYVSKYIYLAGVCVVYICIYYIYILYTHIHTHTHTPGDHGPRRDRGTPRRVGWGFLLDARKQCTGRRSGRYYRSRTRSYWYRRSDEHGRRSKK
jgi:hypothetical protein